MKSNINLEEDKDLLEIITKCTKSLFFKKQKIFSFETKKSYSTQEFIYTFYKESKKKFIDSSPPKKFLWFTIKKGIAKEVEVIGEVPIFQVNLGIEKALTKFKVEDGKEKDVEELFELFSEILAEEKEKENKENLFKRKLIDIANNEVKVS